MNLSQKCQYAVRAILELSKRYGQGPVSAGEIAASQSIPQRFLEIILNELKPSGLVDSRRGVQGGYYLSCPPDQITVGRVIRLVDGPLEVVRCPGDQENACCVPRERCSLVQLWQEAKKALETVYDSITFKDLADRAWALDRLNIVDYSI